MSDVIATMVDRTIDRSWVEGFVRGLGCACPAEVFEQIRRRDLSDDGFEETLEIGARLLIALVSAERIDEGERLLERGRRRRDADGLNRFRLVFVGQAASKKIEGLRDRAADIDDRLHIHSLTSEELSKLIAG